MLKRLLTAFICLLVMFSIVGCSQPKPEESVKNFLDALSKQDMETANSYLVNQNQKLGKDELLRLVYSGVKYEIVSSTINKDKASVKTKVSVPDLDIVIKDLYKDLLPQLIALEISDPGAGEAKSAQLVPEYLNNALSDPNVPMITSEADIWLMKDSSTKKWQIVGNSNLTDAISGSFSEAMDNMDTAFSDATFDESDSLSAEAAQIGQELQFSGSNVTITKIEKSNGNNMASPGPGCEFIVATVHIKNNSIGEITYSPVLFVLETSNGEILETEPFLLDMDTTIGFTTLQPGEECEGTIVFEQSLNDPGLYIHFTNTDRDTVYATFELPQ